MILCKDPKIIVNPAHKELLQKLGGYYHLTDFIRVPFVSVLGNNPHLNHIYKLKYSITDNNIGDYYFVDENDIRTPLFLQVPCNKCILCANHRQSDLVQRMRFEAESHNESPWFITLTFNRYFYHQNTKVTKRQLQLFFKRLREHISRKFPNTEIKEFSCGEYGSKNHRSHYHAIIYGLPKMNIQQCLSLIYSAWSHGKSITVLRRGRVVTIKSPAYGIVYASQVNSPEYVAHWKQVHGKDSKPKDPFKYVSKYVSKEQGCQTWSKGLGKKYALTKQSYLLGENPNPELFFKDRYGVYHKIIPSRNFLDTCFGSLSRQTYMLRQYIYSYVSVLAWYRQSSKYNSDYYCIYYNSIKPYTDYFNMKIDDVGDVCMFKYLQRLQNQIFKFTPYYHQQLHFEDYLPMLFKRIEKLFCKYDFDTLEAYNIKRYKFLCSIPFNEYTAEDVAVKLQEAERLHALEIQRKVLH